MPILRDKDTRKLEITILAGNSGKLLNNNPATRWHIIEDKTLQQFRTEYWGPATMTDKLLTRIEKREYRLDMGELLRYGGAPGNKSYNWGFIDNDNIINELIAWERNQLSDMPNYSFDSFGGKIPPQSQFKQLAPLTSEISLASETNDIMPKMPIQFGLVNDPNSLKKAILDGNPSIDKNLTNSLSQIELTAGLKTRDDLMKSILNDNLKIL